MARLSKRLMDQFNNRVSDLEKYFSPDDLIETVADFVVKGWISIPARENSTVTFERVKQSTLYQDLYDKLKSNYRSKLRSRPI